MQDTLIMEKKLINNTEIISEEELTKEERDFINSIFTFMQCRFVSHVHSSLENIPDTVNKNAITTILLTKAIRNRLSQFLPILIRYGGNPDISVKLADTDTCTTALYEAVRMNNINTVKFLCHSGSHCSEPIGDREKLVFLAAMNGNAKIVKLLIKSGADYTGVSKENQSIFDYEHNDHDKYLLSNCNITSLIQRRECIFGYSRKSG